MDLRKPDDAFAGVLAHQPLQHECEQGQCVGLALDFGLELLHQGRIKHWCVGPYFAVQDFRGLANDAGDFSLRHRSKAERHLGRCLRTPWNSASGYRHPSGWWRGSTLRPPRLQRAQAKAAARFPLQPRSRTIPRPDRGRLPARGTAAVTKAHVLPQVAAARAGGRRTHRRFAAARATDCGSPAAQIVDARLTDRQAGLPVLRQRRHDPPGWPSAAAIERRRAIAVAISPRAKTTTFRRPRRRGSPPPAEAGAWRGHAICPCRGRGRRCGRKISQRPQAPAPPVRDRANATRMGPCRLAAGRNSQALCPPFAARS